jgi:hypothetical protein
MKQMQSIKSKMAITNIHGDNSLLKNLYIKSNYVLFHSGQKIYDIYQNITYKVLINIEENSK